MRVPLSWLKDFVPDLSMDADALTDVCNGLGLIVEGVERIGDGLAGVVVARVLDVRPHPNADRVRLADVDLGDGEALQIACGAANLAAGQLVAVSTIGTTLPNGMTIERRKLRGEWSNGMICSADELNLAADRAAGIMVLPDNLTVGAPFAEQMGIVPDVVLDLEIETNRPDAMCVAGVARDIAAKLGLAFAIPTPRPIETGPDVHSLTALAVERPDLAPRFTLRVIENVTVRPSPELIARRLTLAGMRPINNIVDASNYVMLELGQPSHPYDHAGVTGGALRVRASRADESITTLDGSVRSLPKDACVICDGDDVIVGVAGIMGGASSEVTDATTTVLLEAALFEPYTINKTSRQMALRTDASARFERRIDREGTLRAQDRICEILSLSCPELRVATGVVDVNALPAWPSSAEHVTVRTARVNAILGTTIDDARIAELLACLQFGADLRAPGVHDVVIPSFRPDCDREIDVIEEIARMYGYENIERQVPTSPAAARLTPYQWQRRRLRTVLAGMGLTEAWTATLIGPEDHERTGLTDTPVELANPVAREESLLRTSLLPGTLRAVAYNVARNSDVIRLFEIGHVFGRPRDGETLPNETERLAITLACEADGDNARTAAALWRQLEQTMHIKGASLRATTAPGLHATRTAAIVVEGREVGVVGEVAPGVLQRWNIDRRVGWINVYLPAVLDHIDAVPQVRGVSRYPAAEFDLAFVVPDAVAAGTLAAALEDAAGAELEQLQLFDVFRGDAVGIGRRSLAYRFRVASLEHTLGEADVTKLREQLIGAAEALGASLRV